MVEEQKAPQQTVEEKRAIADTLKFGENDVGIELFYSDTVEGTAVQEFV